MYREISLKYLIKSKQYCDLFQFKGVNLIIKEYIRTKNKTDTRLLMQTDKWKQMDSLEHYVTTYKIVVCNKGDLSITWVKEGCFFFFYSEQKTLFLKSR